MVEVLIAILIGSLMLVAIYLLVGRGFVITRQLTEQQRITEDARLNIRRLSRLVLQAHAPAGKSWVTTLQPYELVFTAQLDDDPELEQVRLFLDKNNLEQTITQLDQAGTAIPGSSVTQTLAKSVRNREVDEPLFTLHQPGWSIYPTLTDITLRIDVSPQTYPPAATIKTSVTPRNLFREFGVGKLPEEPPPPEDAPPCQAQAPYDIMLAIDRSGSISKKEYKQMKEFARRLATSILTSNQPSRIGVVTFATDGTLSLPLTSNLDHALKTISKLPNPYGATNIQKGIAVSRAELKSQKREGVSQVLVLVTDGKHNQSGNPVAEAEAARADGIDIFAIPIGLSRSDQETIEALIAPELRPQRIFPIDSFNDLISALNNLYKGLCPLTGTLPVPPPGGSNPPPQCTVPPPSRDTVLVLDESDSVDKFEFLKMKLFARDVVRSIINSRTNSRLGIAAFGQEGLGRVPIHLTNDLPAIEAGLDLLNNNGGSTDIEEGISLGHAELKQRGRDSAAKYIILITDGLHNQPGDPVAAANEAKSEGITIFLVMIGLQEYRLNNPYELMKNIASKPEYEFVVEDFNELAAFLDDIEKSLCLNPLPEDTSPPSGTLPTDPTGIIDEVNRHRANAGLPPLKVNAKLNAAAAAKLDDMYIKQYFNHLSPEGWGPDHWLNKTGYIATAQAENLALTEFNDWLKDFFRFWMNSPPDRAAILSNEYTESGAAARYFVLDFIPRWVGVQYFGKPQEP